MRVILTLGEARNRCEDWDYFCHDLDMPWAKSGVAAHMEISITEEQALRHSIILASAPK